MKKHVVEFHRRVSEEMNRDGSDRKTVQQTIETAYEQCIAGQEITKSFFLSSLHEVGDELVFTETVEHLFMPVNWSRVRLRTLWAIKNMATGNLLTLEKKPEEDSFLLKESSEDTDRLDYAPMLTGEEDDAKMFIKMLAQVPSDAPLGINETMITMDVDERINVVNLEAAEVKVIF
jgi:hypothetical protein